MDIPTNEPTELRAGDTWQWRREDLTADYPASTWTLSYYFKRHDANFNFNATADGDEFAVSVPAATTAPYTAGVYDWFAFAVNGAERFQVDQGSITVLPDLGVAGNLDARTHARKMLDAIEAVLENKATLDQQSYTIANRSITRYTIPELEAWRDKYRREVEGELAAEAIADGRARPRKIQVRF